MFQNCMSKNKRHGCKQLAILILDIRTIYFKAGLFGFCYLCRLLKKYSCDLPYGPVGGPCELNNESSSSIIGGHFLTSLLFYLLKKDSTMDLTRVINTFREPAYTFRTFSQLVWSQILFPGCKFLCSFAVFLRRVNTCFD